MKVQRILALPALFAALTASANPGPTPADQALWQDALNRVVKFYSPRMERIDRPIHVYNWGEVAPQQIVTDEWARGRALGLKERFWSLNPGEYSPTAEVAGPGLYAAIDPIGSSYYRGKGRWLLTEIVAPAGTWVIRVDNTPFPPEDEEVIVKTGCPARRYPHFIFRDAAKHPACAWLRNQLIFSLRAMNRGPKALLYNFRGVALFTDVAPKRPEVAFLIFDNDLIPPGRVFAYTPEFVPGDGKDAGRRRIADLFLLASFPSSIVQYFQGFQPWPSLSSAGVSNRQGACAWIQANLYGCQAAPVAPSSR